MLRDESHPTDCELLLVADGELAASRTAEIRAHLAACWICRTRMAEVEQTIADFARVHRDTLDPQLPPIAGPRALLKAQLAALAAQPKPRLWQRFLQFTPSARNAAYGAAAIAGVVLALCFFSRHSTQQAESSTAVSVEREVVPDRSLTPGATRKVTVSEVCVVPHEEVVRKVPSALRKAVFQRYGIVNAQADDYEIDYLIAPGLGGKEDIRNLWPQPYQSTIWNARVKDALEERLHQMVCTGTVNLSTAQKEIAADWIAAYKKYFNTDAPLSDGRI